MMGLEEVPGEGEPGSEMRVGREETDVRVWERLNAAGLGAGGGFHFSTR